MYEVNDTIVKRVFNMAEKFINERKTVREIADDFGVSKSTAHKDLTERLYELNHNLFHSVDTILQYNKSVRHIRGGISTKNKFQKNK